MPAAAPITAVDRQATPVSHVLLPDSPNGSVWTFSNDAATTLEQKSLTISSVKGDNGNTKVRLVLKCPVVQTETINGISNPKLVRTAFADVTFKFSDGSSDLERANTVGMLASLLASSQPVLNEVLVEGRRIY